MVPTSRNAGDEITIRAQCPTHEVVGLIGDRWSVPVLIALHDHGESRTADLRRGVEGISQKMLTQTLRSLERHGLVARSVEPTVPVSVSYRLTPLGVSLFGVLGPIRAWAEAHADDLHPGHPGHPVHTARDGAAGGPTGTAGPPSRGRPPAEG